MDISALFAGSLVESERIELKEGWNPESVLHTLSAFANDFHNLGGGYVIIGVAEKDGHAQMPPVGLDPQRIDAIQKEILNLGHSAMQPFYHPVMEPAVIYGKHILILWAPGGPVRPYKSWITLGQTNTEWAYYIRKGSSTVRAKGSDERELLGLANNIPFDDRVNHRATLADLDLGLIRTFLRAIGSELYKTSAKMDFEALCRQMRIVDGPPEAMFPRNVGLLFFNDEPHRFFPQAQIDVVYFPDGAGGDRFEEKIFRGPLDRMLRESLAFLQSRFLGERVIKHPDRAEAERFYNFPYEALEEALANAVYHRGYDEREPIEVRISPEEIIIVNYPGPDRSVRLDQLREGKAIPRRYRNRRIGDFLKELEITEGRSTGIPKILRTMRKNGSPPPEFEFDDDHSFFLVRLPVHPKEKLALIPQGTSTEVAGEVTGEVAGEVARLLAVLSVPMKRTEIQNLLGLKHEDHFREAYLTPALAAGLVEMTIPSKPTSRLQKYRLTAKGKILIGNRNPKYLPNSGNIAIREVPARRSLLTD